MRFFGIARAAVFSRFVYSDANFDGSHAQKMTVPDAYQQSCNGAYQMDTTASISSDISKISAKRLFSQVPLQKILANADKIMTGKNLPEPLQNRGVANLFLLCKNKSRIPPAPDKNALETNVSEAFFLCNLFDLSQWQVGGIGAKSPMAAGGQRRVDNKNTFRFDFPPTISTLPHSLSVHISHWLMTVSIASSKQLQNFIYENNHVSLGRRSTVTAAML